MSRHARITRTAISPRLATRILFNEFDLTPSTPNSAQKQGRTRRSGLAAGFAFPLGVDDESLGRVSDVVERIAGDQREQGLRSLLEYRHVIGRHDRRFGHAIAVFGARGAEANLVADFDVSQRAEEAVAVAGNRAVAVLPRQR